MYCLVFYDLITFQTKEILQPLMISVIFCLLTVIYLIICSIRTKLDSYFEMKACKVKKIVKIKGNLGRAAKLGIT